MKKIAIIGAGEFQNPLILKAKEMGYETHVFAWKSGDIGERTADFFYPISITEKDEILKLCKTMKPQAVVTIASDLATLTVSYVASGLGLPCNSEQCTACSTNKYRMRRAFAQAGVKTPGFVLVSPEDDLSVLEGLSFPLIIKPTDRSGSRGIMKVDSIAQAEEAIRNAAAYSFEKKAIAEEMITGQEYSCEFVSQNGIHHFLALTKKDTTGIPHFIETGHTEPSGINIRWQEKIKTQIETALDALGITTGASHTEFRITPEGDAAIIEIGARMGGDFIGSHLVQLSTGYDFVKMTVEAAAGIPLSLEKGPHYEAAAVRFLFNKEDVLKKQIVKERFGDLVLQESPVEEENFSATVDSSTRAGSYLMAGKMEDVLKAMELSR
ncbi:MAG: ATP-grasp domain-containing protein [Christensenella sp.]|nr:ATP-grasp domain-containing protein [Christensenella sp.]